VLGLQPRSSAASSSSASDSQEAVVARIARDILAKVGRRALAAAAARRHARASAHNTLTQLRASDARPAPATHPSTPRSCRPPLTWRPSARRTPPRTRTA
jgi:hypothetical protein